MAKKKRFTIFDKMDEDGVFDNNPANQCSPDYYRAEYPKMMYHPNGEMRITVPAEMVMTPFGPKACGEQKEIINRIVRDSNEEREYRSLGWHLHPADAMLAAGLPAPPRSSVETIQSLEKQIAELQALIEQGKAQQEAEQAARRLQPAAASAASVKPPTTGAPNVAAPQ
jgi:hypothetical protein